MASLDRSFISKGGMSRSGTLALAIASPSSRNAAKALSGDSRTKLTRSFSSSESGTGDGKTSRPGCRGPSAPLTERETAADLGTKSALPLFGSAECSIPPKRAAEQEGLSCFQGGGSRFRCGRQGGENVRSRTIRDHNGFGSCLGLRRSNGCARNDCARGIADGSGDRAKALRKERCCGARDQQQQSRYETTMRRS